MQGRLAEKNIKEVMKQELWLFYSWGHVSDPSIPNVGVFLPIFHVLRFSYESVLFYVRTTGAA